MSEDQPDDPASEPPAPSEGEDLTQVFTETSDTSAAAGQETTDMATKKTAKKTKAAKKTRSNKTAKSQRPAAAATSHSSSRGSIYVLKSGIPETIRKPSIIRTILEVIEKRDGASAETLRIALKDFKPATIAWYLNQLKKKKILVVRS